METMKLNNNGKPLSLPLFIVACLALSALELSSADQIPSCSSKFIFSHIGVASADHKEALLSTNQMSCPTPEAAPSQGAQFPAPNMQGHEDPEVKKICEKTLNPHVCMSTIGPLVAVGKKDITTVFQLAIKVAVEQAQQSLAFVSKFTAPPGSGPMEGQLVGDCKVNYKDLLGNLKQAREALAKGQTDNLNILLSAAISDMTTCEDAFEGRPFKFPLTQFHEQLKMMVSNCLAISELLTDPKSHPL